MLQVRFNKTRGKRWKRILREERFRAGYDFLMLRARDDTSLQGLAEFWTKVQEDNPVPRAAPGRSGRDRPRRRYRRRVRKTG